MYSQIFLVQVLQEILPRKNACWKVLPIAKKVPFIFKDISESIEKKGIKGDVRKLADKRER